MVEHKVSYMDLVPTFGLVETLIARLEKGESIGNPQLSQLLSLLTNPVTSPVTDEVNYDAGDA